MQDEVFMRLALDMAKGAAGQTSPNPMVGSVVVKNGEIVGMGAHLKAGEPHAEVHALRMSGEKADGATIYVTLEPCSHHGRTPPCADAIVAAGISRAVIASLDPNPLVAGRGVGKLKAAGIEVTVGVLEEEARKLNEVFFHYISTGRPFVTVKTAMTLDGKIAAKTGHSQWITGEAARREVHQLRHRHDAILVGINTVIADDPELTARLYQTERQPVRVILDSTLRMPLNARVVTDGKAPTWVFTTRRAPLDKIEAIRRLGVQVLVLDAQVIEIGMLLNTLGQAGITSLLVEGGTGVNGAFFDARAIQKLISYLACKLIGGAAAPVPFGGGGIAYMHEAVWLDDIEVRQVDRHDLRISGYPRWVMEQ
ncbi:bifunctional diaminohydroxyphosphoribosylaminopyrimidine deaminase/5-amino-6-(5-phosphoribosylamino)uracil reductase RibD [Brevibacillus fluminis]|uniref:Riboflavin biosynthesis protein RibD n=1 Tax=Brevibacillus fluminis TaxID=511487 RepID=A0A3M8DQ86_9BACL|nr:bifunctional diaminohydroxyphosphoribosylaminopyrimidine deaminase/5-amino-6-(5-phosphoribosylamino)uracil reductase RibD [Brevibacillus fluminis]RNB89601.1 bifunctional diaminohydroxyphosphoribosylaminopyrimidine deaminase/5-amino-6-(5-phosphoribosylamino)uracil reductase RibD [Brevibacillus fluminis]